ncbi:MAG TPA: ATP-binding protein [Actinomycetota bacterium]|nr:ATP-binding protein [Actinomycetota bacterium]
MDDSPEIRRPTLTRRLVTRFVLTVVVVLGVLAVILDRTLASAFLDDLTRSLVAQAQTIRLALPSDSEALQPFVRTSGRELGVRITLIAVDGTVVADSSRDPATIENHSDRPEVQAALRGAEGVASRTSETVGIPLRYVALPPEEGLIVRVALPLSIVTSRLARIRALVVGGLGVAALVVVVVIAALARTLSRPLARMTESVSRLSQGRLDARVEPDGTAELALLAGTLNRMAEELSARIQEVRDDRQSRDLILSAMEEGVVLIGSGDEVGYANPAARRILGGAPNATGGLRPHVLRGLVSEARSNESLREEEVDTGTEPRKVRASALPVGIDGRVLLVLRDVTEARRVEAMRRDFVANASHELKTPVASIQAAAETVGRALEEDPRAAGRFAVQLHHEAVRLSRIVSDLLDLSRLETESPLLEPVRFDALTREEVDRYRSRADEAGIDLNFTAQPATVEGASKDLSLLVGNLLDNAVRYTPSGGRVDVEVGVKEEGIFLEIRDTGIGIPARDLPRIFERFYRVDPARSRQTGGTGLGLSIAKHVVEQHSGRIAAKSELGRGSTFRVILPSTGRN